MVVSLPPCPTSLRAIQPYLNTALEHDGRDPVISYWCRLYALQTALTIDKKSDEAKIFLLPLMDWLEKTKRSMTNNDSITSETVAQAYIENYALKLFNWADNMDRAANFNKNVVKSFYTSGMLMDILSIFGELSEDIAKNKKYAKWKAAYINNCLKNGETPVPGPQDEEEDEFMKELMSVNKPEISSSMPSSEPPSNLAFASVPANNFSGQPVLPSFQDSSWTDGVRHAPPPTPSSELPPSISTNHPSSSGGSMKLDATQISKAQKFCKFASSALNYDDIPEAISNLQKALKLLQTGSEE